MFKKYLYAAGYFFVFFFILTFFITIFDYFNLLSQQVILVIKLVFLILDMFFTGIYVGRRSIRKGYLEGIKIGVILIFIFFIFTLFFSKVEVKSILYYIILITSSVFGSMLGISFRRE